MAQRQNTNNPLSSNELADLNDNIIITDEFVNSEEEITTDRFGKPIRTLHSISAEAEAKLQQISDEKEQALSTFSTEKQQALDAFDSEKQQAISDFNAAGTEAIDGIKDGYEQLLRDSTETILGGEIHGNMNVTGELSEGGARVYSANNKPTAADIGVLPISGGTLTGKMTINYATPELDLGNNNALMRAFSAGPNAGFSFSGGASKANKTRIRFTRSSEVLNFENCKDVTINNKSILTTAGGVVDGNLEIAGTLAKKADPMSVKIGNRNYINAQDILAKFATNGYIQIPTGQLQGSLTIQWGYLQRTANATPVTFPVPFKRECYNVQLTLSLASVAKSTMNISVTDITETGFTAVAGAGEAQIFWFAIGY